MFNFYGLFIALGILVGTWVVGKVQKSLNTKYSILNTDVFDLLPWVLIPGVIGARLYHVLDYWQYYAKDLVKIFYLRQGGLGIFGGIFGGIIGIWLYSLKTVLSSSTEILLSPPESNSRIIKNLTIKLRGARIVEAHKIWQTYRTVLNKTNEMVIKTLDLGVIGLSLGQAIGRWGNFFNQELYGLPTNLPWGIYIKPENRLLRYEGFTHFHPLFLYESLGCLLIFMILFLNTRKKVGNTFFLYLFLYSFLRFWLEFLRIEGWEVWLSFLNQYVRITQIITLGAMVLSLLAIYKKFVKIQKD